MLLLLLLPACVDPREARREDAHDLAGTWTSADGTLVVENETDKNDVRATLTRAAATEQEQPLVDLLPDASVALTLVLGEGKDSLREEIEGGENVSFDGGDTSQLDVDGADVAAEDAGVVLRWSLSLTATGDELDGVLRLSKRERVERGGDENGAVEAEGVDVAVAFVRD